MNFTFLLIFFTMFLASIGQSYNPSQLNLADIIQIQNAKYLFTGIPYRLTTPDGRVVQWSAQEQRFIFLSEDDSTGFFDAFLKLIRGFLDLSIIDDVVDTVTDLLPVSFKKRLPDFGDAGKDRPENPKSWLPDIAEPEASNLESEFYFVQNGHNSYLLRNGATAARNIVIKCGGDPAKPLCSLIPQDINVDDQVYPNYAVYPYPVQVGVSNSYDLSHPTSNGHWYPNSTFEDGGDGSVRLKLTFTPIAELEWEVGGMNMSTFPEVVSDEYFGKKKSIWRETVINPTDVEKVKRIKKTVSYTTTTSVKLYTKTGEKTKTTKDMTMETVAGPEDSRTTQINKDGDERGNSREIYEETSSDHMEKHTIEMEDEITIPARNCVDIQMILEMGGITHRKFTVHTRVSAKIRRYDSNTGIPVTRQWAPGIVIPQLVRQYSTNAGALILTQANNAVYEDVGVITSETGVHSRFIVQKIECI